jgi:hypothetical protein
MLIDDKLEANLVAKEEMYIGENSKMMFGTLQPFALS